MFPVSSQQFGRTSHALVRWCRFGLLFRLPNRHRTLHAHDILHFHLGQCQAEPGIVAVSGIGQHYALRNPSLAGSLNLLQRKLWLGLKLDLFGNTGLLSPFLILDPNFRQIQPIGHRHARRVGGDGQTDSHSTVILFADLATVLPGYPHRFLALLRESRIIHHPSHYWSLAQHCWQYKIQSTVQHSLIIPRSIGDYMVQGLMHAADVVGGQTSSHRLNALTIAWKQESSAVILERNVSVSVPCGLGQALDICRKACFLWAWRALLTHANNSTLKCLFLTQ